MVGAAGVGPAGGTYVHSDAEVMLAVLTLEAHRAGALVIGEDLGTVEPEVTDALHDRGMLSSAVLWFTRDRDAPGEPLLPPDAWPEQAVASVSTHDLPTVTGFLRAEHVRARAELGLLDDVAADETKAATDRAELVELLRAEGLVGDAPTEDELVVAIHELLAASRSQLVLDLAVRRRRRGASAQPAGHGRRVPELAAPAAGHPRRAAHAPDGRRGRGPPASPALTSAPS